MSGEHAAEIRLRPWAEGDLALLGALLGDPAMMEHLGGPESTEQIAKRNQRYVDIPGTGKGQMFVILAAEKPVGSAGYWDREENGETVYEMGWSVLPAFQGQGIAGKAANAVLDVLAAERKHRYVHAYPSVDNAASNALCRKAGFTLLGAQEFEYPKGHFIRCNNWRFDLHHRIG